MWEPLLDGLVSTTCSGGFQGWLVLTIDGQVIGVLCACTSRLELGAGACAGGDGVGSEEGVQMRVRVGSGKDDGVDVLVHEQRDIDDRVCLSQLDGQSTDQGSAGEK